MKNIISLSLLVASALSIVSCKELNNTNEFPPIVLGDSATIVTETDSQYLKNNVEDIDVKPVAVTKEAIKDTVVVPKDTLAKVAAPVVETKAVEASPATKQETTTPSNPNDFTLNIQNNAKIVFKGLSTKEFKAQNPATANELAYLVTKGDVNNSQISVQGGSLSDVSQKAKTSYIIKTSQGVLELTALGSTTNDWQKVPVKNNVANIAKVSSASTTKFSSTQIQNAIDKAIQAKKYKASVRDQLKKELAGVKSIDHKSITQKVENLQFNIVGKDAKGASFKKIIRLDQ